MTDNRLSPETLCAQALGWIDPTTKALVPPIHMSTTNERDPDNEYLSDGIAASLINSLATIPKLRVMAQSTVFRYKGRAIDPQSVGRELNVRAVLTGRIMQSGGSLRIGNCIRS